MTALADLHTRWPQISQLLDEAMALPADDHARWLAQLPAALADLRDTLRGLLETHARAESADLYGTLPAPFALQGAVQPAGATPVAGDTVSGWRLLRSLGQGGMGAVWLAERAEGDFRRQVALKLPRVAWGDALTQRLQRERDILATLVHPRIARLYDAGVDAMGRPWLALEVVEGLPIDEYAASKSLDVPSRLKLLLQICDAVTYLHSRLVIHRDLKPSNILVTPEGQVRLLDFGIAKLLQDDRAEATALTREAGHAMTPDYASPEQVLGRPLATTSDVYSLGVVAYELLCGQRPYRLQGLKRASAAQLEEAIAHLDVPLASRTAEAPALQRALRGDIDAILNKALKKDSARRYASVGELAADIGRHLANEPVSAQPDAFGYRAAKFLRRYRVQVAAAGLAVAALLLGTAIALVQAQRAEAQRRVAVAANEQAVASRADAERQALVAGQQRAEALAARELAERLSLAERASAAEAEDQAGRARSAAEDARSEAARARIESQQAQAVRDFLLGLFGSADPAQPDAMKAQAMTAVELLDRGVERIDQLAAVAPAAKVELLRLFADVNMGLGRYDTGLRLIRRAVIEAEQAHGKGSLNALSQRLNLARTLSMVGERPEALRQMDSVLAELASHHSHTTVYANALVGSADMHQPIDPARALSHAQQAVQLFAAIEARAAARSEPLHKHFISNQANALSGLGIKQQTAGALQQSALNLQAAAQVFTRLYGADNRYALDARTRRMFSLLALGRFDEVVREAPGQIEATGHLDMASALLVPQVRLYYGRALVAQGRFAEARAQMQLALAERARIDNPAVSPRLDTFHGQHAMMQLEEAASSEPMRELQSMLAAGQGVPVTRMAWRVALLRAHIERGELAQAREQAAATEALAGSVSASPEMRLQHQMALALLEATPGGDPARLEAALSALREADRSAESDHDRARLRLARAQALHRAGRTGEAAAELRPLLAGREPVVDDLQHRVNRDQILRLANLTGR